MTYLLTYLLTYLNPSNISPIKLRSSYGERVMQKNLHVLGPNLQRILTIILR